MSGAVLSFSMPTTPSFTWRCVLTTQLPVCPFSLPCTADVKPWFMQNGLQLNPDKSEACIMGTANQLWAASSLSSVKVAGVDLPVAEDTTALGVMAFTFGKHFSAVVRSCNYHAQAICQIRHL